MSLRSLNKTLRQALQTGQVLNTIKLCSTCNKKVPNRTLPTLCLSKYPLPPIPDELKVLKALEERMVAARIPFMNIRTLSHTDEQFGLQGCVINVPININDSINILPRQFGQMQTIQIELKRQMHNRDAYRYETIRPSAVWRPARYISIENL